LANTVIKHGAETSVFMLGAAVDFEQLSTS